MLPATAVLVPALVAAAVPDAPGVPEAERRAIVRAIEGLEAEWFQVYESHDLAVLERLIADDFVATLADGEMRGKREHIAAYPADFAALASVTNGDLKVRVFSHDLAVATGLYTATARAGAVSRFRYTDTWLLRGSRWQCVATHENRID